MREPNLSPARFSSEIISPLSIESSQKVSGRRFGATSSSVARYQKRVRFSPACESRSVRLRLGSSSGRRGLAWRASYQHRKSPEGIYRAPLRPAFLSRHVEDYQSTSRYDPAIAPLVLAWLGLKRTVNGPAIAQRSAARFREPGLCARSRFRATAWAQRGVPRPAAESRDWS